MMIDHLNAIFIAAFITKQDGVLKKIIFIKYTYYVIKKNWHQRHFDTLGFGSRLLTSVAKSMGS
jgi:hypothetical protein